MTLFLSPEVSATKCGPLAKIWGVTKNIYGHNFQNSGSKLNQRLLIGYEPTLLRFGSDILTNKTISFLFDTAISQKKNRPTRKKVFPHPTMGAPSDYLAISTQLKIDFNVISATVYLCERQWSLFLPIIIKNTSPLKLNWHNYGSGLSTSPWISDYVTKWKQLEKCTSIPGRFWLLSYVAGTE